MNIPEKDPSIIYGTAWKKDLTRHVTRQALLAGFRAVDTANQPRHYNEPEIGKAWLDLADEGINREMLFLQTKFTSPSGQDHRIPYNTSLPISQQVEHSFTSSLDHLNTTYLDSFLLHGPYSRHGLLTEDWEAWGAMERICESGQARTIGVSNVNLEQLKQLWEKSRIKPKVVQNRCFAQMGWDYHVRNFCIQHHISYQGFSLLTANPFVLTHPEVLKISEAHSKTPAQVVFRFSIHAGMVPLTGTTDPNHMKQDLDIFSFELSQEEVQFMERIGI